MRLVSWIRRRSLSTKLVLAGVLLLLVTLGVSGALAPTIGGAGDGRPLTLVGSQGGGPAWHEFGSVYLLNGTDVEWRESSAASYFDVTMTENGSVLAGFMDGGYHSCGPFDPPCTRTGFRVIDPRPTPRVISEYSYPVRTKGNSETHDVERLSQGEYLVSGMERERIFVVANGTITWQWNASSFYDAPADPTRTDWLHINDVDVLDDDRYLVSVRNANQLVIVQRGEGVVEVINEDRSDENDGNCRQSGELRDTDGDGEIRCGDPSVLRHQHNPQWLGEGAVLVADSQNDRVVELHERNGTWEVTWQLERAGGVELHSPRDADRLPNGNTLITDTLNKRLLEVNESGSIVWSYKTERIPYEAERLPFGEPVGGPTYDESEGELAPNRDVPVLSTLVLGLHGVYPPTPFWFQEEQVLASLVALLLVFAGVSLEARRRFRSYRRGESR